MGTKTVGIERLSIQFVLCFNVTCKMLAEVQLVDRKKKSTSTNTESQNNLEDNFLEITKNEGNYSLQKLRRELILQSVRKIQ